MLSWIKELWKKEKLAVKDCVFINSTPSVELVISAEQLEIEKERLASLERKKKREKEELDKQLLLWEHCSRPAQDVIESLGCVPSNYVITNKELDINNYTNNYSFQHISIEECNFECKGCWYKVDIDRGLVWANKQELELIEKAANIEMLRWHEIEMKKQADERQKQRDVLMSAFDKLKQEQGNV